MSTQRRSQRVADQRRTLQRLTAGTTVGALGLGAALFVQTAAAQAGPGDVQTAVVAVVDSLFPAGGLRPPANPPTSSPGAAPIVTTGGS